VVQRSAAQRRLVERNEAPELRERRPTDCHHGVHDHDVRDQQTKALRSTSSQ
jgi:hypothetical protein